MQETNDLSPISLRKHERIQTLDIIRGFTIFGILIANMLYGYSGYLMLSPDQMAAYTTIHLDKILIFLKTVLVDGKFYSIYSLLFGIGFGLQIMRAREKNSVNFFQRYRRRIFLLLLFGTIHALFWSGDILILYALLGFILILFHDRSNRFILSLSLICFSMPIFVDLVRYFIYVQSAHSIDIFAAISTKGSYSYLITNYDGASFINTFMTNLYAIKWRWFDIIITSRIFKVFGLFLLGLYIAKSRFIEQIDREIPLIKRILWITLLFGISANLILASIPLYFSMSTPNLVWLVKSIAYAIGSPTLALAYVAMITLIVHFYRNKIFKFLSAAGQMALSNYLLQTAIGLLIFRGYGLDLFGKMCATQIILLSLFIFVGQVLFSYIWLKYFNFGPFEWLWRCLTYGKRFPLLRLPIATQPVISQDLSKDY
jgi:uncharacterized protein